MNSRLVYFVALLAAASAALAQVQPSPAGGDAHLQAIDYRDGEVVLLRSAPGYQMMVSLSPDEKVENIAIGDASAWQVNATRQGDRLFLKPLLAAGITNLTVVTNVRTYRFDLQALDGPQPDMPYTVEFNYPPRAEPAPDSTFVDVSAASRRLSRYKLSGDSSIRPLEVSDDGSRTFIRWPRTAELPAIYGIDRAGKEYLVNGMMGVDDIYVVEGAPLSLRFRLDERIAYAKRVNTRRR